MTNRRCWRRRRRLTCEAMELGRRRVVVKTLSSCAMRFPKTLLALSRCRIPKAKGSGDLLSCLPVHTGAWDGEGYGGSPAARRGKTLARLDVFSGGDRWVIYIGKSN
jgi:hypothetical protein